MVTLNEAYVQFAVGSINEIQYIKLFLEAIRTTKSQEELRKIFWKIIDIENDINANKNTPAAQQSKITVIHLEDLRKAFRENEHAPGYLRRMVMAQANNRPLPNNLKNLYPRDNDT